MPELPEVEHFRSLLEPLISSNDTLHLERGSVETKPPRKFLDDDQIAEINQGKYHVVKVIRKGKQIAMNLGNTKTGGTKFLMVHMGMTGRICTPEVVPELKEVKSTDYPPPHVYLKFKSGSKEACFSDPRKFGSILVADSLHELEALAPDAWKDFNKESMSGWIDKLANQSIGIKAMLLDQRRVVSGVGNWVADEVLYQTGIHPDQNFLTTEQATLLLETLHRILNTAVECLIEKRTEFPSEWLFHYRWNSKKPTKDAHGRVVTFVTSGGRTSAIVPSLQQKRGQVKAKVDAAAFTKKALWVATKEEDTDGPIESPTAKSKKRKASAAVKEEMNDDMNATKDSDKTMVKAAKAENPVSQINDGRRRSARLSA
jgi:formamidopyrimidine-DNA glycosylase